jgi:hypothetical protein
MSFSHVYNRNRHVKKHSKSPPVKKTVDETNDQNSSVGSESVGNRETEISNDVMKPPLNGTVARKSTPKSTINANKPFRCHECYKCFTTDDRLLRHAIVHSSDEDVKPLACDFCQKRFLNNSALSCHLKVHRFSSKDN